MNDTFWLKIMGLGCTTVLLFTAIIEVPHEPQIWGPLIGIFSMILGGPGLVRAIENRRK